MVSSQLLRFDELKKFSFQYYFFFFSIFRFVADARRCGAGVFTCIICFSFRILLFSFFLCSNSLFSNGSKVFFNLPLCETRTHCATASRQTLHSSNDRQMFSFELNSSIRCAVRDHQKTFQLKFRFDFGNLRDDSEIKFVEKYFIWTLAGVGIVSVAKIRSKTVLLGYNFRCISF